MVSLDDILKGIFVFALAIVILDFFIEKTLPDYSILDFGYNIIYLIGCLWTWIGIALTELTSGDFLTPLELLFRIFMVFLVTVLECGTDLFFDLITFPFQLIQDIFNMAGTSFMFPILDDPAVYASFDLTTFTFRAGININVTFILEVADVELLLQVSVLGTDSFTSNGWAFDSLGLVGFSLDVALSAAEGYLFLDIPGFTFSVEKSISSAIEGFFNQYSTPEDLYEYLIDYLE